MLGPLQVCWGTWHQNVSKQHQNEPKVSQQNISQSITLPVPASFFPRGASQVSVADGHVPIASVFDSAAAVIPCNNATNCNAFSRFQYFSRTMYSCSTAGQDHTAFAPHVHHWSFHQLWDANRHIVPWWRHNQGYSHHLSAVICYAWSVSTVAFCLKPEDKPG